MKDKIRELLLIVGFASAVYGIHQIHEPAAFIIGGTALIWLCSPVAGKSKRSAK